MPPALTIPGRLYRFILLISITVASFSCKFKEPERHNVSFKNVTGIYYTEVRRYLPGGLAFHPGGYQLSPEWHLCFLPNNKASIYDPFEKKFLTFNVTLDHDSIFCIANTWLKAKKVTKDSLNIQVLYTEGTTIYYNRSKNSMTFYADNYIKNVLHTTAAELQKPKRKDTLFIMKRVKDVNANPDSAFAARQPVVLKSISPLVKIVKEKVVMDLANRYDNSEEYMYPTFDITINKAYEDFYYSFVVTVDTHGEMRFLKSLVYTMDEYKESDTRIIKGIIDGYLKTYVKATPGTTLNMVHNSAIILNVSGKKN